MKAFVKKLNYYPVTVSDAVFFTGTNKSLQEAIDNGEFFGLQNKDVLEVILSKNIDKLSNYRGHFPYDIYRLQSSFRASSQKGDFWINNELKQYNVDQSVLKPYGIVYYDGTYFRTIDVPYSNNNEPSGNYDVCIIGGGAAGIGAAYALKESGWRVCIVERLDELGGTHCNAGVGLFLASPICAWYKTLAQKWHEKGVLGFKPKKFNSTDILGVGDGTPFEKAFRAAQFVDEKGLLNSFQGNYVTINDYKMTQEYYNDLKDNIDIFINCELISTYSDDSKKVSYITVKNTLNGKVFEITADYFIDCSGDGVLFTHDERLALDTDYYIGEDGKDRFNEPVYGVNPANHYGINTVEPIYYNAASVYGAGQKNPPALTKYKRFDGLVEKANFTFTPFGDTDCVSISKSYGTRMTAENFIDKPYVWNMNDGRDRVTALRKGIDQGIRKLLAIRESYRVAAEKTIDQTYLTKQITSANYQSEKIIALSTWYVDIHNQSYYVVSQIANGVPYESMIPKAYSNVLVAGRCFGASHIALSSVRLVKTMMDMGHSAGIAIKQLLDKQNAAGSGEREDVRNVDVSALQQEIGIADVISELETYFYGDSVDYAVVNL